MNLNYADWILADSEHTKAERERKLAVTKLKDERELLLKQRRKIEELLSRAGQDHERAVDAAKSRLLREVRS